jgi:hypothetical protein
MTNMKIKSKLLLVALLGIIVLSCGEGLDEIENPYIGQPDKVNDKIVLEEDIELDPTSIEGLQKLIFEPTCANNGCHDGSFEPDLRTAESAYNTLVNRPIVKNDELNPLVARVSPGNADASMLIKRLETDLNENSGKMPLLAEPGSGWSENKDLYISYIRQWIDDGAKDINGNAVAPVDYPPQLLGIVGYSGSTLLNRSRNHDPMEVPAGVKQVDIWFSYLDDITAQNELTYLEVNFSLNPTEYDQANSKTFAYQATPKTEIGFTQTPVQFYHKITVDLSSYAAGDVVWLRTLIGDKTNELYLPGANSLFQTKTYCALKLMP